jgi:hypothetical protein
LNAAGSFARGLKEGWTGDTVRWVGPPFTHTNKILRRQDESLLPGEVVSQRVELTTGTPRSWYLAFTPRRLVITSGKPLFSKPTVEVIDRDPQSLILTTFSDGPNPKFLTVTLQTTPPVVIPDVAMADAFLLQRVLVQASMDELYGPDLTLFEAPASAGFDRRKASLESIATTLTDSIRGTRLANWPIRYAREQFNWEVAEHKFTVSGLIQLMVGMRAWIHASEYRGSNIYDFSLLVAGFQMTGHYLDWDRKDDVSAAQEALLALTMAPNFPWDFDDFLRQVQQAPAAGGGASPFSRSELDELLEASKTAMTPDG